MYVYVFNIDKSFSDSESLEWNGRGHNRQYKNETDLFQMTA